MEQKRQDPAKELAAAQTSPQQRLENMPGNMIESERDHLLFVLRYALAQNFKYRPRKREHYAEDDFAAWAQAVLAHMELTGLRFFKERVTGNRHFSY
jgi:hypothetical protein